MATEEQASRREFLKALGGSTQKMADHFGEVNRQTIDNDARRGFAHCRKEKWIAYAHYFGVEPHPELYTTKATRSHKFVNVRAKFFKDLADAYGGFPSLAIKLKAPMSSIRFMCQNKGRILKSYVSEIDSAAREAGIEPPLFLADNE